MNAGGIGPGVLAGLLLVGIVPAGPALARQAEATERLIGEVITGGADSGPYFTAFWELRSRLRRGGDDGEKLALSLLDRTSQVVPEPSIRKTVEDLAARKKTRLAALLLLEIAKSRRAVRVYEKGRVAVGRLVVEDGKDDPELVLAQMEILPEGYFAGDVGDLQRPLVFRAWAYAELSLPLAGRSGEFLDLGTITLKPCPRRAAGSLKGRVVLDAERELGEASVELSVDMGPPNTSFRGFSPRSRWPEPQKLKPGGSGDFAAAGLSPTGYYLRIEAPGHASYSSYFTIRPGQDLDLGEIRLRGNGLASCIGRPPPGAVELNWEKDYPSALRRAREEKKPLMVMMTATWCGPCKLLEKETLGDPWIRRFLSRFVVVKAYEDPAVEKAYGLSSYPTLVFADSDGKEAFRAVGYRRAIPFAGVCAQAIRKLGQPLPDELGMLVEKRLIPAPE